MTAYRPFIDDPEHRRLLEGQRYVVLRVRDPVRAAYRRIQGLVRERLAGLDLSYPAEPHVTLLGLGGGTDLEAVRELVNDWAREVPPLQIDVERMGEFRSPFQIVIIQIRRTSNLFIALSRLRERARQRGLKDLATVAPDDWIFHLSLVYGSSLSAAAWATVSQSVHQLAAPAEQCIVSEAEIIAFDDGRESSGGVVALSGAALAEADDHETV